MENIAKEVAIDWEWVSAHLSARERLGKIAQASTREALLGQLKEALRIAASKAVPRISLAKRKIANFNPASIELERGVILSSKELSRHLRGATDVYAFLVTIGKEVEDAATLHMNSSDHLLGYLLDRVGSFAVEALAKNTEDCLRRKLIPKGLSLSMRFSPGYCDWPIEEQLKLVKIIGFAGAGVTLSENYMMIPKKSISAVAGIGPKELFAKVTSPCAVCNMKICDYRRRD